MIFDSEPIDHSKAALELITRHFGIYIDVINQYSWSLKIQIPELRDDLLGDIK